MKKLLISFLILAAIVATASFSVQCNATETGQDIASQPCKTYQVKGFSVDIPEEFVKSEGWSSETNMRLNSEASHMMEDGEEYSSSATIDVYQFDDQIQDLNQCAITMKCSREALDEKCDDPIVADDTILLRTSYDVDDDIVINWHFMVRNADGRLAGGVISYHGKEAKYYDCIVKPIIQSIQFK